MLFMILFLIASIYAVIIAVVLATWYKKVAPGQALISTGGGETLVSFESRLIMPWQPQAVLLDMTTKRMDIDLIKENAIVLKDGTAVDLKTVFFVSISKNEEDIIMVVNSIGAEKATKSETLHEVLLPKFLEAIRATAKMDFCATYTDFAQHTSEFKTQILEQIERDINGYIVEAIAIAYFEKSVHKSNAKGA